MLNYLSDNFCFLKERGRVYAGAIWDQNEIEDTWKVFRQEVDSLINGSRPPKREPPPTYRYSSLNIERDTFLNCFRYCTAQCRQTGTNCSRKCLPISVSRCLSTNGVCFKLTKICRRNRCKDPSACLRIPAIFSFGSAWAPRIETAT